MANLNCEAILTSQSYVCGRERKFHTHALILVGVAWRNMWARTMFAEISRLAGPWRNMWARTMFAEIRLLASHLAGP
jgi:hypothetical protein